MNDDFEILGENGGGDLSMFETYKQLDVDKMEMEVKNKAKVFISSLCDLYLDLDRITNETHVKAVATIETSHLSSLLSQVEIADHTLKTVMRQLDAGAYTTNPDIYNTIIKLQQNSMNIIMTVSKYTRQLPEAFKFTHKDIHEVNAIDVMDNNPKTIDVEAEEVDEVKYDGTQAFMGTKDILQQAEQALLQMENDKKEIESRMIGAPNKDDSPLDDKKAIDADVSEEEDEKE